MQELARNLRYTTFDDTGYSKSITSPRGISAAYCRGPGMQKVRPITAIQPVWEGSRVIVWPDPASGPSVADLPQDRDAIPRTSEHVTRYNDASKSYSLPYRRSVSTSISQLPSSRPSGPEHMPLFEHFVASQALGKLCHKINNHKKQFHHYQYCFAYEKKRPKLLHWFSVQLHILFN
jgi:hypothetical protein